MIVPCLYVILCNLILINAVWNCQFELKFQSSVDLFSNWIFSCVFRGCSSGVLFWALWEIQCYGAGAAGPQSGGPFWPLRQNLFPQDRPDDRNPAGQCDLSLVWDKDVKKYIYRFQHIAYIYHRSHGWSLCTQEVWSTGTLSPRIFWWVGQGPRGNIRSTSSTLGLPKNTSTLRPKNTSLTGSTRA